jgi:hypothetical protein
LSVFAEAAKKYHPKENREYQVWQDRFDDVAVYSDEVLRTKIEYIHNNPVKAGLADSRDSYAYSSARNYDSSDHSVIRVDCWQESGPFGSGCEPDTHAKGSLPTRSG